MVRRQRRWRAPASARASTVPAMSVRTARRSARSSSPQRASARCPRRCRAPRVPPALAAPTGRIRRSARSATPRRRRVAARPPRSVSAAPLSDGPELMIIRRAVSSRARAAATLAKCSARPAPKRVAGADVHDDQSRGLVDARRLQSRAHAGCGSLVLRHFDRRLAFVWRRQSQRRQQIPLVPDGMAGGHQRSCPWNAIGVRPRAPRHGVADARRRTCRPGEPRAARARRGNRSRRRSARAAGVHASRASYHARRHPRGRSATMSDVM